MNQAAQRAFIKSEAGGRVKFSQAGTARRANPMLIQRKLVLKRRMTAGTEMIRLEGSGGGKALRANRDARPAVKGAVANAAIRGENQRKNAVRDRPES